MAHFRLTLTAFILLVSLSLTGCSTPAPTNAAPSTATRGTESRLRSGDQLSIRLDTGNSQAPSMNDVVIDENGEITLQLIGRIQAAGSTASELAERIQANYVPRYYVHCTATVLATIRFFYIGGEVRNPGRFNWSEDITLLKAINTASGFTEFANRGKVELTHGKEKKVYNCEELRQHPDRDVTIQPGDSLYVPRSIF